MCNNSIYHYYDINKLTYLVFNNLMHFLSIFIDNTAILSDTIACLVYYIL